MSSHSSWMRTCFSILALAAFTRTGNSSKSTSTCSARSSASARVLPTQQAIGSPTKRTLPCAKWMLLRELEGRQRGGRDDRLHFRHVLAEENAPLRARGPAQAGDARVRHGGAEERHLPLAWQDHVGHEAAAAVEVARILLAGHARADPLADLRGVRAAHGVTASTFFTKPSLCMVFPMVTRWLRTIIGTARALTVSLRAIPGRIPRAFARPVSATPKIRRLSPTARESPGRNRTAGLKRSPPAAWSSSPMR